LNPQFTYEQKHLKDTLVLLDHSFKFLDTETKDLFKKYREGIKAAARSGDRQDNVVEEMAALNQMMELRGFRYKEALAERLKSQKQKPYFARIKFTPFDTKEELDLYIGKHNFNTNKSNLRIYDWRAPICSLYYNYPGPEKTVTYEFDVHNPIRIKEIIHKKIDGDLNLRRSIDTEYNEKIKKPELIAIYDNSARVDLMNKEISKKTGGVLQDIVQTIQLTQNKIIRTDRNAVAVIQGTAGSGKTTVAIHRISFLLYSHPDLKEKEILLLSASKVLANYIEKTLPELEIYALTRDTLEDFLLKKLKQKNILKLTTAIKKIKDKDILIKTSPKFLNNLDRFIKEKNEYFTDFVSEAKYFKALNLQRFFDRGNQRPVFTIHDRILENLQQQFLEVKIERKKGNITVESKIDVIEETITDLKFIKEDLKIEVLYKEFLQTHYPKLPSASKGLIDIVILYYLANGLVQIVEDEDKFRQIVVDEGQELSEIHFRIIKDLGFKAGYTILGDLNQSTEDSGSISDWSDLEKVFKDKKIENFNIKTSYRNTKQISEYSRKILEKFKDFKYLPEPFDRNGKNPKVIEVATKEQILESIIKDITDLKNKGNKGAVGILEPNDKSLQKTFDYLKSKKLKFSLITEDFKNFTSTGIYLVNQELVKGLEFDTVFIIDPNQKLFPPTPLSAKKLFVMCTRAINNLYIYHCQPLSELLV